MATITGIRTGYVDYYLHRQSTDTRPWTAAEVESYVQSAMDGLWRDGLGLRTNGDVATNPDTNTYTLPTGMLRIRRIDIVDPSGIYVDRVANFRVLWDDETPTSFVVQPVLASGYTMKVLGYKPFDRTASDLPQELESLVGAAAASLAWRAMAGELLNSKRQQNEDTGRVVSYQDAIQSSDFWMATYRQAIERSRYLMRTEQVAVSR